MNFVADTHALIWWFIESPKISPFAAGIFEQCERGDSVIIIPTIVIAEALSIFDKRRVSFDFKKLFRKIHGGDNYKLVALDYTILQRMVVLRDIPELHDKIIAATALSLKLPIITKDRFLHGISYLETIW